MESNPVLRVKNLRNVRQMARPTFSCYGKFFIVVEMAVQMRTTA